uniref:CYP5681B1 protein n=1 Tax=Euplotes crassus TaxID=5936 RepID=A0A1S5RRT6_EUPCR|nr:CYP5681B1 protein [Moneuplotes crassus]
MILNLIYTIGKYLGLFGLAYFIYVLYCVLVVPYLFWRKYSKYPNVKTHEKFVPVIGDIVNETTCMNQGKVHYEYRKDLGKELEKYDIRAKLDWWNPVFMILSNRALEEVIQLQKASMAPHGFGIQKTNAKTIQRRKNVPTWLGLNGASKFIPHMIECCKSILDKMEKEGTVDLMHEMNSLTFNVFVKIMLGDDIKKLESKLYPYTNPDGKVENITLKEMLIRLTNAYVQHYINPLTFLMPFLNEYHLVNPYKRDYKNNQMFKKYIKEVVESSDNEDSIGKKFLNNEDCTPEQRLDDMIAIMIAGTETTSHSLVSCLYYLDKHPDMKEKLKKELEKEGFVKGEGFLASIGVDSIQNCTYLNCVVKETLRCDTVIQDSFDYECSKDITICDVPIPKGSHFRVDLVSSHYDDKKWLQPKEFIPERFDFESEFYKKSKELGLTGDVYSRRSFGHGNRACPGQSFALLEMKIAIAYFTLHLDYSFSEEDLSKDGIGFALMSQFNPKVACKTK